MGEESPISDQDRRTLRYLKGLVTVLTGTMILGLLSIVVMLVIRLQPASGPSLPDAIVLPDGTQALAFTQGPDWYAVVTTDDRILIHDRATGRLRQEIAIETAP